MELPQLTRGWTVDRPKKTLPAGLMPWYIWGYYNPEPAVRELLDRYEDVLAAVGRYRAAGLKPPRDWLRELGVRR